MGYQIKKEIGKGNFKDYMNWSIKDDWRSSTKKITAKTPANNLINFSINSAFFNNLIVVNRNILNFIYKII